MQRIFQVVSRRWRVWPIFVIWIGIGSIIGSTTDTAMADLLSETATAVCSIDQSANNLPAENVSSWAFEETFDGDPGSPSQTLLPDAFEYVATHRTHPQEMFTKVYDPFPADHDNTCAGPNPAVNPLPSHMVNTVQTSNSLNPDESFFICKNHMMTAMGEVGPYSNNLFWPRQEFDFSNGGTLEFEVNINLGHTVRHWWEVMIVPQDQMMFGSAPLQSAVDETYPSDRIVFDFRRLVRTVKVGTNGFDPDGWITEESEYGQYDFRYWNAAYPNDPALTDRRIRRTMRITFVSDTQIRWSIEKADGTFDDFTVDVPQGLPFDRGLVVFKTHAYTPSSDNNYDTFTFHWDNIRFTGPVVGQYVAHHADDVVYLQANGNRPVGDSETVNINLPSVPSNPALFGQVNNALNGQVLLSVNGRPDIIVHPYNYADDNCTTGQWQSWVSFRVELDPSWLQPGNNSFEWTVGPRPACAGSDEWTGYSIKFLHLRGDGENGPPPPPPPNLDFSTFIPSIFNRP